MKVHRLVVVALFAAAAHADVALEGPALRLILGDDARWRSIYAGDPGRELCPRTPGPVATVWVNGKACPARAASLADAELTLHFAGTDTVLTYQVAAQAEWILFRLVGIDGARPTRITLLTLETSGLDHVGRRLNAAWDEELTIALLAANRQVDCGASRGAGGQAVLAAVTQDAPGPRLEGAQFAILAGPTASIRGKLQAAAHAFGLLTNEDEQGLPSKEGEAARGAYWFLDVGQTDGPQVIDYCRRSGIRQVMIGSGSWCTSPGHYLFSAGRYPGGEAGLKALVDQLHAAGILVGMHTFVSKVSKLDPYVTPKPDRRFWVDKRSTLAAAVVGQQTEIRAGGDLREWPGSPVCSQKSWEGGVDKHREVILDDEIVQYQSIGPDGRWDTFQGCKRGAWGTAAASHLADTEVRHNGVDGCINGYIIDQETDLLDEVAVRIAGIFNRCGFDMVYFDGGEDVDKTRFNHYVSRFQEAAVQRFAKRPIVHMGTIMTHLLWHSFTRSGTVDTYLNTLYGAIIAGEPVDKWPTVREHIDRSVDYLRSINDDLMPGELGWFGIWPKGRGTDGLQLDEFEHLMCKSVAWDAPVSLQTSFSQMESHPLTPALLELFKIYDSLRMRRQVSAELRASLAVKGRDYALILANGKPRFVQTEPLAQVAGGREARGCLGLLDATPVATLWHTSRDAELLLGLPPAELKVADLQGKAVSVRKEGGQSLVAIGPFRLTLTFPKKTIEQARALLESAVARHRPASLVTVEAEAYGKLVGSLAKGSTVGITEPEASGDVMVPTGPLAVGQPQEWYCEYTVTVPHAGRWTLWARVRYPSGVDDSFGLVLPGQAVTLQGAQVLGNCGATERKWHWTGRGAGTAAAPPGEPLVLTLPKGPFTFRIYAREGSPDPKLAPRLDAIALSDGPDPPEE
ncbi:MAG: hypothetical protein HYU66_03510 [Armatimonadetes bacterium]|nr:hypothetical protein [Armatimonadota bacterium]